MLPVSIRVVVVVRRKEEAILIVLAGPDSGMLRAIAWPNAAARMNVDRRGLKILAPDLFLMYEGEGDFRFA